VVDVVDNTLSPHGGKLVDRVITKKTKAIKLADACKSSITIRGQIARQIISIAYGFFSPLEGFMTKEDLTSVCENMTLANGYVWSIPLVFDMSDEEISRRAIKEGHKVLLEYHNEPFAVLEVDEIYSYDKNFLAKQVFGTDSGMHPGVARTRDYKEKFVAGKIDLIHLPLFQEPFDQFFFPPKVLREEFQRKGWKRVVALQARSVPHTGHEWLMKGGWFQHRADAVLVSCVIGEKHLNDCIDECVLLGHNELGNAGYFKEDMHMTSFFLWDVCYASSRCAVFHALVRKNMGCTGHIFGSHHANTGDFYGKWEAHEIFKHVPDLGIEPILSREWYYCPDCGQVTYADLCGHNNPQNFGDTQICEMLLSGVKPPSYIMRPEVFDKVIEAADKYGCGDGYVTDEYLQRRNPIFRLVKF
jgi:sulfate adenylyltransferase